MKWAEQKGFTIVELLIVIVVIAILAAITIVSYNGIQNRAKNQQVVTAVAAYYKALQSYAVDNADAFPTAYGCLGSSATYGSDPCYQSSNTYSYNATLNNSLAQYLGNGSPSMPMDTVVTGENVTVRGIFYHTASSLGGKYLGYIIYNSTTCPSIAGAPATSSSPAGAHIYCRIMVR